MYPDDRHYSKEHEWVILEDNGQALVGITPYAKEQLGDVVFVELAEKGTKLTQFQKLGEVESVKAVSDLFIPLAGEVTEVNQALVQHPELINEDPYGGGWLVRLGSVDSGQMQNLLSAAEYQAFLSELD